MVGRAGECLAEMDSTLNTSPKMSSGVLERDVVMLQNYMLMTL